MSGQSDGFDRFFGGEGTDRVVGSSGDDVIGINVTFNAGGSIEEIDGGAGFNVIRGTTTNDSLDFSATTLTNIAEIQGGDGHDTIVGSAGDDVIVGGAHNDTMTGGLGNDTFKVSGQSDGFDRFYGGEGTDRVVGSSGDDTIGINVTFNPGSSIEEIDGGAGHNIIQGTTTNDSLDFSATTLTNIDEIHGGSGHDTIIGSSGNDVIVGGAHNDTMFGGAGNDTFLFDVGSGIDVIGDFGAGDALRFRGADFSLENLQIEQQGNGVVIRFDGIQGMQVTLKDVDLEDIQGYSITADDSEQGAIVVAASNFS